MNEEKYVTISKLSQYYRVDVSLFSRLDELGLIKIHTVNENQCIHHDMINNLERMLRLHEELGINLEGIDTIFNLLEKIEDLQNKLIEANNKLRFYEGGQ
ncbi:MAG: chaperone modulator CbpM [Cyclobacteriaceae bacterium]